MRNYDLRDLELAGVKWEITDIPMTMMAAAKTNAVAQPQNSVQKTIETTETLNAINRIATSVVPPIAPIIPISIDTVRAMAARPSDINALNRMIAEFKHPLQGGAKNTVLIHQAQQPSGLMIITDIPSADDDSTGKVLSGDAGEMMNKMLNAIGLSRENTTIMPIIFWRTPGGRSPSRTEIDLAKPFVMRAIELTAPKIILSLGTLPAMEIGNVNIAKSHGVPVTTESGATLVPIYHPNYLILKPTAKRDVWDALQNVQNMLKSL